MGIDQVQWTLQLKEVNDNARDMSRFNIQDMINKCEQSERDVRRNVSILLSLSILKSDRKPSGIYYEYIGGAHE